MNFVRTRLGLALWTAVAIALGRMAGGIADVHIVIVKGQPATMQQQGAEPDDESDSVYLWRKI